jgi:hypothetical protein
MESLARLRLTTAGEAFLPNWQELADGRGRPERTAVPHF